MDFIIGMVKLTSGRFCCPRAAAMHRQTCGCRVIYKEKMYDI